MGTGSGLGLSLVKQRVELAKILEKSWGLQINPEGIGLSGWYLSAKWETFKWRYCVFG
jgi:hypothetical protein